MYELIIELLLFFILFFLWLSSPGIEGIRNLLFIGIIYLGVVLRHGEDERRIGMKYTIPVFFMWLDWSKV